MATEAWKQKELKKRKLVARYAKKRAELKAAGDFAGLAKLPRNSSRVRLVNRCKVTGRRHGFLGKFKMSRLTFRELALDGKLPGVTKASW